MKKIILLGLIFLGLSYSTSAFADFGYPFAQIAKPSCRKDAWSTLDETCKMALPRITGADYAKYKNDTQYRRIYTVLWGATYDYGWDVGLGSHIGVDIATSAGTPVLSISDGVVVSSTFSSGWGNFITIKHTLADKTNIYSNYAHLSVRSVNVGDTVTLGQTIGQVGNTGNSYGNHLHFQIDTTDQLHPYYYVTCGKGKDSMKIVNTGDCRTYLQANTIDPIAFLETGVVTGTTVPSATVIETIQKRPTIIIEKTSIKSREEILNEEAEEYLRSYIVDIKMPARGIVVPVGTAYTFNIESRDFNKNLSIKNLPGAGVKISVDSKLATVLPENFTQLSGGVRAISITPKVTGPINLIFTLGKKELARKKIFGIAKGSAIKTSGTETLTVKEGYLGQEYDAYISPLTDLGFYVGTNTYSERYRIEVMKGKAKFCIKVPPKGSPCNPADVVEMVEISRRNTPDGFYPTKIIPLSTGDIEIRVTRVGEKAGITSKLTVNFPIGIDRRNLYYDAIVAGLTKNWWKTRDGYVGQDMTLTTDNTKEMILRVLDWRVLRAGNDLVKKRIARGERDVFIQSAKSLPQKTWTRAEFANLLLKNLNVPVSSSKPVWTDEKGTYQNTMTTLRTTYKFKWQDQFGERYFQPDKAITVAEALYLAGEVVK